MGKANLLQRRAETRAIADAVKAAASGSGRVLLVEGEAGIGKTALLELLVRHAESRGMLVEAARGGRLEREFPFAIPRRLFETNLARRRDAERQDLLAGAAGAAAAVLGVDGPPRADVDLLRALHGLYWLCANLAEQQPLALVVDDAHWADAESWQWLAYMTNRAADLALLVAVGVRAGEEVADRASLDAIRAPGNAAVLRPTRLGEDAAGTLVRSLVGEEADVAFCRACHAASGGNPFYLRELALETQRHGIAPVAASAERVALLGPEAVSAATLTRLARLTDPAADVARAVAILGLDAEIRHVAALAGVDIETAEQAADALSAAGILAPRRPLNFIHPVVAAAIRADMPPGATSQAHARAAELIAADGGDPGVVGSHLLLVDPAADERVRERLDRAAAEAMKRGAPSAAARFLRRALAESADPTTRAGLAMRLGRAELVTGDPSAVEHLRWAHTDLEEDGLVVETALLLSRALMFAGRFGEVEPLVRATAERLGRSVEDPSVARLHAEYLLTAAFSSGSAADVTQVMPRLLVGATRAGAAGRLIYVVAGMQAAISVDRCGETVALIERALDAERFIGDEAADSLASGMAACALAFVDALDEAEAYLEQLAGDALRRSSVLAYVSALPWRGWIALRRGNVPSAIADLRAALDLGLQHRLDFTLPFVRAFLAEALLDDGRTAEAIELAEATPIDELPIDSAKALAANARGQARLAGGRRDEGIADLAQGGVYQDAIGHVNPNATHWRSRLAVALGRASTEAHELVEHELALARQAGCGRAVGVALRAAGRLQGGDEGLQLLREAAATLEATPARLEYARTLAWEGAELRRSGRRAEAREPLRQALDIADSLGATSLALETAAELEATGGRPRRRRLTGVLSLTPTERRVADLAASGFRNREIAQTLFVSRKTVEMHLGSVYRKLGIHSREELGEALSA
jgi:DNA-binding CsgD family transcriptional regulator